MKQSSRLTRRNFIKAPAAAALAGAPAFLSAQSANDQVRVGMIGVGGRGTTLLRRVVQSPNVRIVAICDIDPEARDRAAEIAAEHKPDLMTEYRKLLDRKDIDAIVIATPVDLHKEMALAALEVHKHLYLEKPMGRTPEEVQAVMQAAAASRGQLQLGFQLRYDPARIASIQHIQAGGIGPIAYMQANRHTPDLPREKDWLFRAEISGNSIVEQAVHIIDLMNWAMNTHPLQAYGSGGVNVYRDQPQGRTTWDNYIVIYEYPNDVRLAFSHLFIDPSGFSGIQERVWGAKGAIDLPQATVYLLDPQGRGGAEQRKLEFEEGVDATQRSLDAFFQFARDNQEPLNNAHWGRLATLTAIMGRTAIEQKRVVKWEEVAV
jgi:predicted dehydrogenase